LKKIIKEIFFNNIGLTCNSAELIILTDVFGLNFSGPGERGRDHCWSEYQVLPLISSASIPTSRERIVVKVGTKKAGAGWPGLSLSA